LAVKGRGCGDSDIEGRGVVENKETMGGNAGREGRWGRLDGGVIRSARGECVECGWWEEGIVFRKATSGGWGTK